MDPSMGTMVAASVPAVVETVTRADPSQIALIQTERHRPAQALDLSPIAVTRMVHLRPARTVVHSPTVISFLR